MLAPSTWTRKGGAVVAAAALLALASSGAGSAAPAKIASTHSLAALLVAHGARSGPSVRAALLAVVEAKRPLTGERTVLPILGRARGPQGATWLHVSLPGRPNGHTGWIRKSGTRETRTSWAVVVNLGRRQLAVYRYGRSIKTFRAVVGKPSTPTPQGQFFVEESFPIRPGSLGAPYAIALSARSTVYQQFDGGPGQIAVHGIEGIGGQPGTAASHGCIRLDASDMAWLGHHIRPGVPVTIVGS